MLSPFLFVGLGGSGGLTLRYLHRSLERRLRLHGIEQMPEAWQFVQIDVPSVPDGQAPDLPPQLPTGSYVPLIRRGFDYKTIDQQLASTTDFWPECYGWRPNPADVHVQISTGAGQYRALGRAITVVSLKSVAQALQTAASALSANRVREELDEISLKLTGERSLESPEPFVVVVSSLAGGSGAGALIDVCDALRLLGKTWAAQSTGVLYAPDVFASLSEGVRGGVQANALAALSEIMAGAWLDSDHAQTSRFHEQSGLIGSLDRRGPQFPFIVGAKNMKGIAFNNQLDVFRTMAEALAAWSTSPEIQNETRAFLGANWDQAARRYPDRLGLRTRSNGAIASSLGYSAVNLGRDRLEEYSSGRLARRAVNHLLRWHLDRADADGSDVPPDVVVAAEAESTLSTFLSRCGLNERGESHNEIIDGIRSLEKSSTINGTVEQVFVKVTEGNPELRADEWAARITTSLDTHSVRLDSDLESLTRASGREWCDRVQERLLEAVREQLAERGLAITQRLLELTATELANVAEELRNEAAAHDRAASTAPSEVALRLGSGRSSIPARHPDVRQAIVDGVQGSHYRSEASLRRLSASVMVDLAARFIEPLARELGDVEAKLWRSNDERVDGRLPLVRQWSDGPVPQSLVPPRNELLVESIDEFPSMYDELLVRSTEAERIGDAEAEAMRSVIQGFGDFPSISQPTTWRPDVADLAMSNWAPASARFDVDLEALQLLDRAERWLERPGTAFSDALHVDLATYLDDQRVDERERNERRNRFLGALRSAIDASDPLAEIDYSTLSDLYDEAEVGRTRVMTRLPFGSAHPVRSSVEDILIQSGEPKEGLSKFFADGDQQRVEISTFLANPWLPMVFDGLVRPIAEQLGATYADPAKRASFWQWRRSRPLTQSTPVPPAVRRAIIRGWYTAKTLDMVRGDGWQTPLEIWIPDSQDSVRLYGDATQWARFPHPLVGESTTGGYGHLAAVLESLPVAMVQIPERSRSTVAPYVRLFELGKDRPEFDGDPRSYSTLNREVEEWIASGSTPWGGEPRATGESAAERRSALQRFWENQSVSYADAFRKDRTKPRFFEIARGIELEDDVNRAFEQLNRATPVSESQGLL